MKKQIKSKKRVSNYGEVYTNKKEVNAMLDLVSKEASNITSTFLEPACGNGNFIIEILNRKMQTVKKVSITSWELSINTLKAVSSVYGVDIQADNVIECVERIKGLLVDTIGDVLFRYNSGFYEQWSTMIDRILNRNLVVGNTLTGRTLIGYPLEFSEWIIHDNGLIIRRDQRFSDILSGETNYVAEMTYRNLCDFSFQILA